MVQIKLPDGSVKEYPEGVSPREVAEGIGKRLADAAVAAVAEGRVVDLDRPLENGNDAPIELRILTPRDREALDVLRHSTAHIMARAIMRLFPGVRLAFGPTTAQRLLLRRRGARPQPLRGRLPGHRGRDGPDPQGRRAVRAVHPAGRRGPPVRRRPGPDVQGRAHRRRAAQVRRPELLPPGRVRRPLPRAAHPPRRQGRRVQAALDRRGLLEGPHRPRRCSSASTAPPSSTRRTSTPTSPRSRRPRSATTAGSARS